MMYSVRVSNGGYVFSSKCIVRQYGKVVVLIHSATIDKLLK